MGFFISVKLHFIFYTFLFLLSACGTNTKQEQSKNTHPFEAFNGFPDTLYKGLVFDTPFAELLSWVKDENGEIIHADQYVQVDLIEPSSTIIFPTNQPLSSVKIFLKNNLYVDQKNEFKSFLKNTTTAVLEDAIFSVFYYENSPIPFKLTYFEQENAIRLHFIKL